MYKITEIAAELKEKYGENKDYTAQALNRMLIETGDIEILSDGFKHATAKGRGHGICGEWRISSKGEKYWQILYDENGKEYVIQLATNRNSSNKTNGSSEKKEKPTSFVYDPNSDYTRAKYQLLKKEYPSVKVFLLQGKDGFWCFDESATALIKLFNLQGYYNAKGESGLTIDKEDLHNLAYKLRYEEISFAICTENKIEIYVKGSAGTIQSENSYDSHIHNGTKFTIRCCENGKIIRCIFIDEKEKFVVHVNGQEIIVDGPKFVEGFQIITPESAIGKAIIKCKIGDEIEINGSIWELVSIDIDDDDKK